MGDHATMDMAGWYAYPCYVQLPMGPDGPGLWVPGDRGTYGQQPHGANGNEFSGGMPPSPADQRIRHGAVRNNGPGQRKKKACERPDNEPDEKYEPLEKELDDIYEGRMTARNHLVNDPEQQRFDSVKKRLGDPWEASTHPKGCRVVQKFIQICSRKDFIKLLDKILDSDDHERFWEAVDHQNANYVLLAMCDWPEGRRRIIKECDDASKRKECDEAQPQPAHRNDQSTVHLRLALHRYGCRILPRIIEHDGSSDYVTDFIDKVLHQSAEAMENPVRDNGNANSDLCRNRFGHHVARTILEFGAPQHKKRIADMLQNKLMEMATDRQATYVIEDVLEYCAFEDKEAIIEELTKPENIIALAKNQFGSFVVSTLATVKHDEVDDDEDQAEREAKTKNAELMNRAMQVVKEVLQTNETELRADPEFQSKHAKKLLDEILKVSTESS